MNKNSLVIGALTVSLLANGYFLGRQSMSGDVKFSNAKTSFIDANGNDSSKQNVKYSYNYGKNVVSVSGDAEYVPLTNKAFEDLCQRAINKLRNNGIVANGEDIVKFVTMFNIDKLKQDNQQLLRDLLGTQTVEEFFDDGKRISYSILDYEADIMFSRDENGEFINPEWRQYYADLNANNNLERQFCPNTDLIMSIADFAFDETQQKLIRDFEARRNAILKESNLDVRNGMIQTLLEDLVRADSEFRLLEEGPKYFLLRHCVEELGLFYCRDYISDRINISGVAYDSYVRWIGPYGSTEEEYSNSIKSVTMRSMMDSLKQCKMNYTTKSR